MTLDLVKKMEPSVLFSATLDLIYDGWVMKRPGIGDQLEYPYPDTLYAGQSGIEDLLGTGSKDGSQWIPAECDFSIRPGWFYHTAEDNKVKSGQELFERYLTSVGRGVQYVAQCASGSKGLFHENDLQSLKEFSEILKRNLLIIMH